MPESGISIEELKHVAEVARLNLTEKELETFQKQIGDIINWFKQLGEIDTKDVKPSFHPLETVNVSREDKVEKCMTHDEAFSNTDHEEEGYFKAPRIV